MFVEDTETKYNSAMRKDSFLLIIGIVVFITPFLGVPESWKAILLFILGGCVMVSAFFYRLASRKMEKSERDVVFTENEPLAENAEGV